LKKESSDLDVAIISDARYVNEADWIHSCWDGDVIHLRSYTMEPRELTSSMDEHGPLSLDPLVKTYSPAPNEQEKINDPKVRNIADYLIEWEHKKMSPEEVLQDKDVIFLVRESLIAKGLVIS